VSGSESRRLAAWLRPRDVGRRRPPLTPSARRRRWYRAGLGRRQAWHRRIVLLHVGGEDGVGAGVGLWRRRRPDVAAGALLAIAAQRAGRALQWANRPQAQSGNSVREPPCGVAFDVGAICPHFRPRAIRRCTDRLSRINRSRDKMRGAASFAKIRASATGESDLPCIKVTCRAYMAPSGRLPVRGPDVSGRLRRPRGIP